MNRKYRCEQCNESFDSIKQYINHLELHKNALVEIPKEQKKKSFWGRIFGSRNKTEVVNMAEDKKTEEAQTNNSTTDGRIDAIENAIGNLQEMIVSLGKKVAGEEEEKEDIQPLTNENKGKLMRLTIKVKEKDVPELVKEVQENDNYEMENIEVCRKK